MAHRVAIVVLDRVSDFELAIACEVFAIDRKSLTPDWYDAELCLGEPGPVRTEMGLSCDVGVGLAALASADTIVVPAAPLTTAHDPFLQALREAQHRGARIVSLCTGAFLLAAAGLLDGRRATTHWGSVDRLAQDFPTTAVDGNVLYVQDGTVFTSAGSAAAIDLCLHLVRIDFGTEVANAVARRLVVAPHRDGGQAQYVDHPLPRCDSDSLGPVLDWALAHLDQPLTIDDLARRASVSPRTLVRRFAAATGTTPLQWLLTQRLRRAQHLLESSDESVERIAELSGLGTAANLRQHFARALGVAPMRYRRTFRGAPTDAAVAAAG